MERDYLEILREGAHCASLEDAVASCHRILKDRYPGIKLRWSRIYGPRWSHIYGDASDIFCLDTQRVQISKDIGLCIENAADLPRADFARMIDLLKHCFQNTAIPK